ncbi:ATP F0F1 synthase subunit alpha [Mycoplasmopsis synoviae]|uniref:ATP F0F1 synthase subunit alpha n=1 Tax=Mycoplasmopsis synoviae TaxID=2109 RepID=A0AAQ0EK51_MYCSY|nr:ATP F0F1 synthase subunit alpha [Mycoplasmopsis synoviae]AKJ21091.1 ATP synthase alpha chain-like protein [Mycoplasmopsis synoviae]AQU48428.1 ATP synthase alpha chain-like protein [Mycoplasmopsis synoviae]AWL83994.1 ATP F0F1 synthase subunit alpha [Mycoplasmopsis synoviae]QGL45150.1 ATP F0F1 synthase subunit alpha [Mycoplasmopsis synoviae]QLE13723.1 ATP F0F1 synthase subunit alpha [Mycoplasmopsis synoviae]
MTTNNNPTISAIFDYVVEIKGQLDYHQNQIFYLKSNPNLKLLLISATKDKAYCLASGTFNDFHINSEVVPQSHEFQVATSKEFFGKIIDIQNNIYPHKAKASLNKSKYYSSLSTPFNNPKELLNYQPLKKQLLTGYVVVDLLIPIGRGQRQLIIGDRKTGKTFLALNTIINQKNQGVKCIYVAIGQQHAQLTSTYQLLKENGALDHTIIINAPADSPYEQYLAPYVAMAHAENIAKDEDVLVIFDDLTTHANIYREIALLTNKPVGKEAFPGDMFFAHSRLLERSGRFAGKKSITALPILQTVDNDISSLIASNIISITDGQLVTNANIFQSGQLPAIDTELSVSRIGAAVQEKNMAKTSKEIGKIYKAYKRQAKLSSLKYDLNDETNALIVDGQLVEGIFSQKGVSFYNQKTIFLTSKLLAWGLLRNVSNIAEVLKFIEVLVETNQSFKDAFDSIDGKNSENVDESLVRDYFAFALLQYAEYKNYNWKITLDRKFDQLTKAQIMEIEARMENY